MVKILSVSAGDEGSIPVLGRSSGVGNGNPLQYSQPGKFHGQRSPTVHGVTEETDTS